MSRTLAAVRPTRAMQAETRMTTNGIQEREDRRAHMRKIGAFWSPVVEGLVQVNVDIERRAA